MSNVGFASGFAGGAGVCARAPAPNTVTNGTSSAPRMAALIADLAAMCFLPCADPPTSLVEHPLIVALADLEARIGRQLTEHRRPHVEHREVRRGTRRRHGVGPEEEAVWILV